MSSAKEDALSPDELRKRLYQTFKSKGVLDALKTQLRNQLIQELKNPPLTGGGSVPRPVPIKSESFLLSACNSIVADYLRTSGYEYSLSIFHPESGLCKDKIFTKDDLLQLLQIRPDSPLYKHLSSNRENDDKGFLLSLLTQLTHSGYTQGFCHDADTQTTHLSTSGESLVEKMKLIDKEYEGFKYSGEKWFSFQSKIDSYRKEMEQQMEAEMKTKIQHFKDVEIAKVKMEEKAKFHKEFNKLKQELEETYEMKSKALMEREKNAIARLQKQQEIEEKDVYMQRQSVLKEIETLRNRDSELRLRTEAFEKTCQIHEEKVKTTRELLRRRELAVKTLEDTHDQRLKNELSRYQFELKEEFVKRTEKLTENETRNKVETARIRKETAELDARLEEHSRACSELRRQQVELDTAHQQVSLLSEQKEVFRERLENMSDYSSLKREKTELQGQLRLLKKQLEEAYEENQLLRVDLGRPSKEQMALQLELQRVQNAWRLDVEEFDNQKQVLQAQLKSEVERCAQLQAQVIEYEEKSQWMSKHVDDIETQVRQTQQALENEVLRIPKPSLVDRSVLELSTDKLVPPDIYMDRAVLKSRVGCDVYEPGSPSQGHKFHWSDSPDSDMELVADAKARIQELQREAEILEEAYRTYQQRAVVSTISHMLLPRPLSPQLAHPSHHPDPPLRQQRRLHPPQTTRTPSRKALHPEIPNQSKVTFLEYPVQVKSSQFSTDHSLHSVTEPLFARDRHWEDEASTASRHMSSTQHSPSRKKLQTICTGALAPDRELSGASCHEVTTSGDILSELSPPHSPQLRSTARDPSSAPKPAFSISNSSPEPDKISLHDLTEDLPEHSHIPELLLDTAVPLSEEAPDGPAVPRLQTPQHLPEAPADMKGQEVPQPSGDSAKEEETEDEGQKWERQRRQRKEQRQREQEEAQEREQRELERLEKEMLLQQVEQTSLEQEDVGAEKGGGEKEQEVEDDGKEPQVENPLEKYMKMVLDAREKQHAQSPGEEAEHTSPEAKSLFEEKDDSIAAFSQKDEDDEFW